MCAYYAAAGLVRQRKGAENLGSMSDTIYSGTIVGRKRKSKISSYRSVHRLNVDGCFLIPTTRRAL